MDNLTTTFDPKTTEMLRGVASRKAVSRPTFNRGAIGTTTPTTATATPATEKKPGAFSSAFSFVGSQLMKPIGLVAQASEDIGTAIGTQDLSYLAGSPARLGGILTGTRKNSFTDIYRKNLIPMGVNPTVATAAGLFVDIFADPLNLVGGGLTKSGQLAAKVTALKKAGQVIAKDSKLAKEITKLGLTADDLILAGTKEEQALKGQRAFLKLAGLGMEKTLIQGDSIYAKAGLVNKIWKTGKVGKVIDTVFNTKTSDEAFNAVKTNFDNLYEYRRGKVMEEAVRIQKAVSELPEGDALRVIDVIETGKKSGVSAIDNLAIKLKSNFDELKNTEKGLGLLRSEIQDYFPHIKVEDDLSIPERILNMIKSPRKYNTALGSSKKRKIKDTISEIKEMFGTEFFEERPAIAYAKRALASARAVTSKEFFDSVKPFASVADDAVEVAAKELQGMKFAPDVARGIDDYYAKIKPEELNTLLKTIDSVQNWWKAQALVAPSYHIRNFVGNMWNNHLAGVNKAIDYADAMKLQLGKSVNFVDDAGRQWDTMTLIDEAKKMGVIGDGWYAKDIETAIGNGLDKMTFNPLKQNFALFRANRQLGTVVENNSRLAHFVSKIRQGATAEDAAMSVKKYLFDYADLTWSEKNIMKRLVPFYTWSRKNIPLQLESLIKQPGKFADVVKTKEAIESNVPAPNEKYLGSYIRDNVGIRYKKDNKGVYSYFLLGNWLPAAQALDFLSQPFENTIQMITPFLKTPVELWSNKSTFFKDNFGKRQPIERYPMENESFLGLTMRKKTVNVLKNVRLLNELDKLNPGSVWGSEKTPSLLSKALPKAGVNIPYIGPIAPAEKIIGKTTPEVSGGQRFANLFLGKSVSYKESMGKKFYKLEKDAALQELQKAHKDALRNGQKQYAKLIREQIKNIQKK